MDEPIESKSELPKEIEDAATDIVDSGYKIHMSLGPGLLEKVYKSCLMYELRKRGLYVQSEVKIPISYDGLYFDTGFRADLIVNNSIIIEIKSIEPILPVHEAQLLTYLKLTGYRLGFLINFNTALFQNGIIRRKKKLI